MKDRQQVYWVWAAMIQRCTNPRDKGFQRYGGRGIKVCARWRSSFDLFALDMGDRPEGRTLERIDSDGDYTPENCKWATTVEQNNNRSMCIVVEMNGERMTLKQAWRRHAIAGLTYRALHKRFTKGQSIEEALSAPVRVWPNSGAREFLAELEAMEKQLEAA